MTINRVVQARCPGEFVVSGVSATGGEGPRPLRESRERGQQPCFPVSKLLGVLFSAVSDPVDCSEPPREAATGGYPRQQGAGDRRKQADALRHRVPENVT